MEREGRENHMVEDTTSIDVIVLKTTVTIHVAINDVVLCHVVLALRYVFPVLY